VYNDYQFGESIVLEHQQKEMVALFRGKAIGQTDKALVLIAAIVIH